MSAQKLAATPEILKELQAHSQRVPTNSIPALRAYDEGMQLARTGDNTKAVTKFEEATTDDSNFAMAFSKLAQTYAASAMTIRPNARPAAPGP